MLESVPGHTGQDRRTAQSLYKAVSVQSWKTAKSAPSEPERRTAGPIPGQRPAMHATRTAQTEIAARLDRAASVQGAVPEDGSFRTALAQMSPSPAHAASPEQEDTYSFEDIIDIVNPLHHIPVVGYVYRSLSGDTIKPMSEIIGGALYGGPAGAVSSTINAVVRHETGQGIAENVYALVSQGTLPGTVSPSPDMDHPQTRLESVAQSLETGKPLPENAMAFSAQTAGREAKTENLAAADGRTAGLLPHISYKKSNDAVPPTHNTAESLPPREAVTQVSLPAMPPRRSI